MKDFFFGYESMAEMLLECALEAHERNLQRPDAETLRARELAAIRLLAKGNADQRLAAREAAERIKRSGASRARG